MYVMPGRNFFTILTPASPAGNIREAMLATIACINIIMRIDGKTIFPILVRDIITLIVTPINTGKMYLLYFIVEMILSMRWENDSMKWLMCQLTRVII